MSAVCACGAPDGMFWGRCATCADNEALIGAVLRIAARRVRAAAERRPPDIAAMMREVADGIDGGEPTGRAP